MNHPLCQSDEALSSEVYRGGEELPLNYASLLPSDQVSSEQVSERASERVSKVLRESAIETLIV